MGREGKRSTRPIPAKRSYLEVTVRVSTKNREHGRETLWIRASHMKLEEKGKGWPKTKKRGASPQPKQWGNVTIGGVDGKIAGLTRSRLGKQVGAKGRERGG